MGKSLLEYAASLDERKLLWPACPDRVVPKAQPYLKPLANIRGVVWNLYGTLLFISDGKLLQQHPQQMRMQVALEKTIQEFNMWQSMSRKPGQPWEYMLQLYNREIEDRQMKASPRKGEAVEVDSAEVWKALIEKLGKKEYTWDVDLYGDLDDYAEKVAFFFHRCLQGVAAAPNALETLMLIFNGGFMQGMATSTQCFSLAQLLHTLNPSGGRLALGDLFLPSCITQSYRFSVKQPSALLMESCVEQYSRQGLEPREIAVIGTRVHEELAPAKKLGFRVILYAGDKQSLQASSSDMKDEAVKPDRILTDLKQLRDVLFPDPPE